MYGDIVSTESRAAPDQPNAAAADSAALPEKRRLPPFPDGDITQEEGKRLCKVICDAYPVVFDGKKGNFHGAKATMHIKEGHMEELLKNGVRPATREPFGLEDSYNEKLDELLEDCVPIDGHEVLVASQVVSACET